MVTSGRFIRNGCQLVSGQLAFLYFGQSHFRTFLTGDSSINESTSLVARRNLDWIERHVAPRIFVQALVELKFRIIEKKRKQRFDFPSFFTLDPIDPIC